MARKRIVVCPACGLRHRIRPACLLGTTTCPCGQPLPSGRSPAQCLGDALLFGLAFGILLPTLGLFDDLFRNNGRKHFSLWGGEILAVVGLVAGGVLGGFAGDKALSLFDWMTEKRR